MRWIRGMQQREVGEIDSRRVKTSNSDLFLYYISDFQKLNCGRSASKLSVPLLTFILGKILKVTVLS